MMMKMNIDEMGDLAVLWIDCGMAFRKWHEQCENQMTCFDISDCPHLASFLGIVSRHQEIE